jgi:hypothetical protein
MIVEKHIIGKDLGIGERCQYEVRENGRIARVGMVRRGNYIDALYYVLRRYFDWRKLCIYPVSVNEVRGYIVYDGVEKASIIGLYDHRWDGKRNWLAVQFTQYLKKYEIQVMEMNTREEIAMPIYTWRTLELPAVHVFKIREDGKTIRRGRVLGYNSLDALYELLVQYGEVRRLFDDFIVYELSIDSFTQLSPYVCRFEGELAYIDTKGDAKDLGGVCRDIKSTD